MPSQDARSQSITVQSETLRLDKESDGGRWLLTCALPDGRMLRLRVTVGGPWDWFDFVAEVQAAGSAPTVLARFDIAPMEIIPQSSDRYERGCAEPWNPDEEPDFSKIPEIYKKDFVAMVQKWGQLAGILVPAPAWLTIH